MAELSSASYCACQAHPGSFATPSKEYWTLVVEGHLGPSVPVFLLLQRYVWFFSDTLAFRVMAELSSASYCACRAHLEKDGVISRLHSFLF